MFQSAEDREHLSLMLSEVLGDIGLNKRMVLRRRRVYKQAETLFNFTWKSVGINGISYYLGSQIEGTTTSGLNSDTDHLVCLHDINIIQDWSEWERGKSNYFMIQDEDTTPGYCFLQLLKDENPLPVTVIPNSNPILVTDRRGRILHKNTLYADTSLLENETLQGPSINIQGPQGFGDSDRVVGFSCKSWPKSASGWLERQGIGRWPTQNIRTFAGTTSCFVVPTGSKVSENPELEWRISTSLAERCLMFDLNITQIRCYVLMKMVIKSLLNPEGEIILSSFMCKTILFHCIENEEASIWKEHNLLECLKVCFRKLHSCVWDGNLSHCIIPKNNLMAGQFTNETKNQLLKNISDIIENDVRFITGIDIDDVGNRFKIKLNLEPARQFCVKSQELCKCFDFFLFSMMCRSKNLIVHLKYMSNGKMKQYIERIMYQNNKGNELEHAAFTSLTPFIFSTIGSILASASIDLEKNQVPLHALLFLEYGSNSDISSGRLKLASVSYSAGDMENTELTLRHIEILYYFYCALPICGCTDTMPPQQITANDFRVWSAQNEDCFINFGAFCVRFLKKEMNCVPRELQYEMFRSTQDDIKHKTDDDNCWMDMAVVDSLPFLYFLQYKVYRHLHRHQDQQQALCKLANIIKTDTNLGHKETALNLLGQCREQENRPKQAIKCYLISLRQRARNNAAKIHICRLLSRLIVDKEIDKKKPHTCSMICLYIMQYLLELNRSY